MKKTLLLLALLPGLVHADVTVKDNLKADTAYMLASHGKDTQNFTLSYTISSVNGDLMSLGTVDGSSYQMVQQEKHYIGLKLGSADPGATANYNYSSTVDGTGTMTVKTDDQHIVSAWLTRDQQGSNYLKDDSAQAKVTITSTGSTSSVRLEGEAGLRPKHLDNTAENKVGLNLKDIQLQTGLSISDYALTVNGKTKEESIISGTSITSTVGAKGYADMTTFNFAVMPGTEVESGAVIAAYYSGDGSSLQANFFTLTKGENDTVYFTANMGSRNAATEEYTVYTGTNVGKRTVTLSGAPIEFGREYTVIITGVSGTQTVYLFDDKAALLATDTYNGNMNGNLSSGVYNTYTNDIFKAPEPATATLSLLALAALAARRKRH